MADINGGQRFAGRTDFIRQYLSIIFLKLGINQNHLIFAADDFRGNREDTFSPGLYTSSDSGAAAVTKEAPIRALNTSEVRIAEVMVLSFLQVNR